MKTFIGSVTKAAHHTRDGGTAVCIYPRTEFAIFGEQGVRHGGTFIVTENGGAVARSVYVELCE